MNIDPTTATILGSTLASALTGAVISILSYLREGRAHRWAKEQAAFERAERIRVAEELKQQQDAIAAEMKLQHEKAAMAITLNTQHAAAVLAEKIDQNTEISVKAFDVANNVNEKLVAIGEARLRGTAADRL